MTPLVRTPSPTRRAALRCLVAGAAAAVALPGCGAIELGQPEQYTPPPPGIDDLYRVDLIALLDRAEAGTEAVAAQASGDADPALQGALDTLSVALPVQRSALLTGAEQEREDEDAASGAPDDVPATAAELVAVLVDLRELCVDAARQVSGALARPVAAIGAHAAWIAVRLVRAADEGDATSPRPSDEIVPTREVPESDPPSVGAESDYHLALQTVQEGEWFAGYAEEVLAARTEDDVRDAHLARSEAHRERAEQFGEIAEEDDGPLVAREAVYPLPDGALTDRSAGELPTELASGLLTAHLALVGAAPFARRSPAISYALREAVTLSSLVADLPPVPSLEADAVDVADEED